MTSCGQGWPEEARAWLRSLWPGSRRFRIEAVRQRPWGESWTIDTDDGRFWFKAPHPRLEVLRWIRDVTFNEDRHHLRIGNAPQAMSCLPNLTISLIRLTHGTNTSLATVLRHPDQAIKLLVIPS